jgi:hypothetical protein
LAAILDLRARNLLRFAKHGKAPRLALVVRTTRFRRFEFAKPTGELGAFARLTTGEIHLRAELNEK